MERTESVLEDVRAERARQRAKWGEQNLDDGTGGKRRQDDATAARFLADLASADGSLSWRLVLEEEVAEALAESDPERLRAELVQVAAVAVQWIEALDRRGE